MGAAQKEADQAAGPSLDNDDDVSMWTTQASDEPESIVIELQSFSADTSMVSFLPSFAHQSLDDVV